jgi:glycosyltransferase involved in cell wall biosynthesis
MTDSLHSGDFHLYLPNDTADWERRHEQGKVPSKWPYGLDQLQVPGRAIRSSTLNDGLAGLAAKRLRLKSSCSQSSEAVTWDEYTATKVYLATGHRPIATGVIWFTDWLLRRDNFVHSTMARTVLRGVDRLWTLGSAQSELLREALDRSGEVSTLLFGVDPDFFNYSEIPDEKIVFTAGNDPDRDIAGTLQIARTVRRVAPDVQFVIQTSAPVSSETGIHIVRSMKHTEIRDMYQRAHVVLVNTRPNTHISGMTVALEAFSSGRPVVVSDTIGMDEYVRDPSLRFSPGDTNSAVDRIISLLDDREETARLGWWGRTEVETTFNTTRMAADLSLLLNDRVDASAKAGFGVRSPMPDGV